MLAEDQKTVPLSRFCRFQTADLDKAREIVARNFCAHRLDRASGEGGFDACQNRVEGRSISLNYIRYGADVEIEPGELDSFFLIQIPIAGHATIRNGRTTVSSSRRVATILNPDRYTAMRWHAGCEQLLLQIDRGYVREVAERMTGMPLDRGVRFSPRIDLDKAGTQDWFVKLRAVVRAAEAGAVFSGRDGLQQRLVEESLIVHLLETQPSGISPLLERPVCTSAPAVLKRALAIINERFADPLSLLDIATAAGTTPRTLQLVFRKELGQTPMECLQDRRLSFARHLLLSETGHRSVGDAAHLSGHRHFGRFSAAYKERYGEHPRETLHGAESF